MCTLKINVTVALNKAWGYTVRDTGGLFFFIKLVINYKYAIVTSSHMRKFPTSVFIGPGMMMLCFFYFSAPRICPHSCPNHSILYQSSCTVIIANKWRIIIVALVSLLPVIGISLVPALNVHLVLEIKQECLCGKDLSGVLPGVRKSKFLGELVREHST